MHMQIHAEAQLPVSIHDSISLAFAVPGPARAAPRRPNVASAGGLQRVGAKGAAVVGGYCKPLATPDLESSGFPEG
jgi:hypothetical protein